MSLLFGFTLILFLNITGFALPALLAAWLFTLALPIAFNQALWLSLGMIVALNYIIQTITDMPGQLDFNWMQIVIAIVTAFILLALSGLLGWLLLLILSIDLTAFEATLLFAISLAVGLFFMTRSGSVGFSRWMTLSDIDLDEDDYITPTPQKRPKRQKKSIRRWTN